MKLTSPNEMRKTPDRLPPQEGASELNNILRDLENDLKCTYLDGKSVQIVLLGRFGKYRKQINDFYQMVGWKRVKVWTTFDNLWHDYVTVFTFER